MGGQNTESVSGAGSKLTFVEQAIELAGNMKRDSSGKYQYPEGEFSADLKDTAMLERRRRDTDSTNGKLTTKLKASEAIAGKLTDKILASPKLDLSIEEQKRLSDLMYDDPVEWRKEMNKLESGATSSLKEELVTANNEATQQAENETRQEILAQFNTEFPDANFSDKLLEQELPPRMWKDLENGNVSFGKFLRDANTYINKPKKVVGDKVIKGVNLGNAGGGSTPSKDAVKGQLATDYEHVKF